MDQLTLYSDLMNAFGVSLSIAQKIINTRPPEETEEENYIRLIDIYLICLSWKTGGLQKVGEDGKEELRKTIYLSEINGTKLFTDGKSIFDLLCETKIDKVAILYLGTRIHLLKNCGFLKLKTVKTIFPSNR